MARDPRQPLPPGPPDNPLLRRIRWGNVRRLAALLAVVVLAALWPRLAAAPPALPPAPAVPVVAGPAIDKAPESTQPPLPAHRRTRRRSPATRGRPRSRPSARGAHGLPARRGTTGRGPTVAVGTSRLPLTVAVGAFRLPLTVAVEREFGFEQRG